jgi:octaprenyl-diphosphate synthase
MLAAEVKVAALSTVAAPPCDSSPCWRGIVEPVEPFLRSVAACLDEQVEAFEPEIATYVRYALGSQGKQLRPALVALSAATTGGITPDLVTAAAIVEMVHLATLVHDDITDEARVRRRRPTLAAHWGNACSVLVGDCLFAHALTLAASFPTPEVCQAVAQATKIVCSGEIRQTQHRGDLDLDRTEYFQIVRMKTAELFALSCGLGARLAGASPRERQALREYGLELGAAYQVYDDCLDLFGSETQAGKSLGTDLAGGKLTLPVIVALERATSSDRAALQALVQDWEPRRLERLLAMLERYDALSESQQAVGEACQAARDALAVLPTGQGRTGLVAATVFLTHQTQGLGATHWSNAD